MLWPVNKDSCSLAPSGEWDKTRTGGEAHTHDITSHHNQRLPAVLLSRTEPSRESGY